jgi:hypothetical protein
MSNRRASPLSENHSGRFCVKLAKLAKKRTCCCAGRSSTVISVDPSLALAKE